MANRMDFASDKIQDRSIYAPLGNLYINMHDARVVRVVDYIEGWYITNCPNMTWGGLRIRSSDMGSLWRFIPEEDYADIVRERNNRSSYYLEKPAWWIRPFESIASWIRR